MSVIKSEKMINYLDDYGKYITPHTVRQAIIIAEQEAEERHEKQMQKLIDAFDIDKYHMENNHQIELDELRNRAMEAFKIICSYGKCKDDCGYCDKYYLFIEKLTEKQ